MKLVLGVFHVMANMSLRTVPVGGTLIVWRQGASRVTRESIVKKSLLKAKKASMKLTLFAAAFAGIFLIVVLSKGVGAVGDVASFLLVIAIMSFGLFFGLPRLLKTARKR